MSAAGVVLSRLVMTCQGCPAQWDAWDPDGAYYYIRYRHGWLTVDKAANQDDWWIDKYEEIYGEQVSDRDHGFMSSQEMLTLTGMRVAR